MLPNGSRGEETVKNKTKPQGVIFISIFVKKWNLESVLFIFIYSLINSKSQQTSTEFGLPEVPAASLCSKENGLLEKETLHLDVSIKINVKMCP